MYGIIKKSTKEFFCGFDSNDKPVFSHDESKAWRNCRIAAEGQASLLLNCDRDIQRKPVIIQ